MADSPDQSEGPAQETGPAQPTGPARSHNGDAGLGPGWRTAGRLLLGGFLILAGVSHLGWSREAFYAQVPPWLPLDRDFIVVASGLVEIALGAALLLLRRRRTALGWVVAAFFVAVFPGNISQFATGTDLVRPQFGPEPRNPAAVPAALGGVGPVVHGRLEGVAAVPESPPNRQVTRSAGSPPDEHWHQQNTGTG